MIADGRRSALLISAPWRLANWPSLAVGVLKAHLRRHGVAADGLHLHFGLAERLGFGRYEQIANGWELGEAIYGALYAPEERGGLLGKSADILEKNGEADLARWTRGEAIHDVESATLALVDGVDLSRYALVGFSIGALQLAASLYIGRLLKERAPHLRVVFGGPGLIGEPGENLLRAVPWIDVVVDGEGESALLALATCDRWTVDALSAIPNTVFRGAGGVARGARSTRVTLDADEPADMDEFYLAAQEAGCPRSWLVLPVEASRGCAWEHRRGDGRLRGCTFCGLYRNSPNARQKSLGALWREIRLAVARTQCLELSFVDAYLPAAYVKDLLRRFADPPFDATLFCESRCDLDEELAELYARAGTRRLQLGVEAFDTHVLAKMEKGVRAIDNVSSIKLCERFGIPFQYNVLLRVPGVTAEELARSTELLPRLHAYRPPSKAEFYLDRGSRMHAEPSSFGIRPGSLDRERLWFLPEVLGRAPLYQVVPFEADMDRETREAWSRFEQALEFWREQHQRLRTEGITQPLSYRDSGETVTIQDHRGAETEVIILGDRMREVFLGCDTLVCKRELCERLAGIDMCALQSMLDALEELGLLLQETNQVLSLPVRARLPSGATRAGHPHA